MEKVFYTVVVTKDVQRWDDFKDSLKFICTDRRTLANYTGISYDRLTYIFTRVGKTYLHENDNMIFKTTSYYKSAKGGFRARKKGYSGFNRNI